MKYMDAKNIKSVFITDMYMWSVFRLAYIIPIAIKPYLVAKAGKSIYSRNSVNGSDPEGNNFYGAGAGMNVRNLQLELFYSITELDDTDGRRDDEMEQVTLMAGYKIF